MFADLVVLWQEKGGRHHFPWQQTRDPYRVWLSEIMLQQTQVGTVLGYYERFLARFPTVKELANAHLDDVLALWAGLGYYTRARNLHRCAQAVEQVHGGAFPCSAAQLQTLPGIGRSTAAAIASFCFGERVAILDANVKRVLTRVLGFDADLAKNANEKALWAVATELLPQHNLTLAMPRYTQGLMDLGATLCTARKPQCLLCPANRICVAKAIGRPEGFPVKTRKLKRSTHHWSLLWAEQEDGAVWLEKRAVSGVWGGLYCLPVFESDEAMFAALASSWPSGVHALPHMLHVLTHKDLYLAPWTTRVPQGQTMPSTLTGSDRAGAWFDKAALANIGLPAPIRKLLDLAPRPV